VKKTLIPMLVVLVACVALLLATYGMARNRQSALLDQPPLSLEELDRVTAAWIEPKRSNIEEPAAATTLQRTSQEPAAFAPGLIRALSQLEREALWPERSLDLEDRAVYAFCETAATAFRTVGLNGAGGWYWEAAQEATGEGDFKTARAYYREALNYPAAPSSAR
jgi:hypothetical protein